MSSKQNKINSPLTPHFRRKTTSFKWPFIIWLIPCPAHSSLMSSFIFSLYLLCSNHTCGWYSHHRTFALAVPSVCHVLPCSCLTVAPSFTAFRILLSCYPFHEASPTMFKFQTPHPTHIPLILRCFSCFILLHITHLHLTQFISLCFTYFLSSDLRRYWVIIMQTEILICSVVCSIPGTLSSAWHMILIGANLIFAEWMNK